MNFGKVKSIGCRFCSMGCFERKLIVVSVAAAFLCMSISSFCVGVLLLNLGSLWTCVVRMFVSRYQNALSSTRSKQKQ